MSTTFESFGLAEPILRAVTELGYREPTPIQAQAIPIVLQGRDVMGAAQTGTGKTAGFALPILQRLMQHANTSASPARHPVRALILAPTRELADQIYANVRDYAKHTGLRAAVVCGGVDIAPQIAALRRGCEVLIATPGRLLDHVGQKTVNLGQAEMLVLDEADRMLDMGFLPDIQRIIRLLPEQRQNLMFSATFSGDIRKLAETFLNDPVSIEVARRNAAAENVEQLVYRVAGADAKRAAVAQLVRQRQISQVIVFTNTKIGAGRLARQLEKEGLNADAIHGDKSQQERLATLDKFKRGETTILVATDVAARGLDIAELPAVINYDLPYSPEDYIHRIGRTGRAGASGLALSLMTGDDERLLADIEKLLKRKLPAESLAVDLPVAEAGVRERRERRGRDEADAGAAPARRRRRETEGHLPKATGYSNDPFFYKPYEPEVSAVTADTADSSVDSASSRSSITGARRTARPVPALLGGIKKSS
ncbi:MAG: DEAD/DEAH box helicase [Burkholderiales bacterium]|nr:DEAD/DEAH box helicase [Burkholderiales bacterium]